jgi:hypothetical protein
MATFVRFVVAFFVFMHGLVHAMYFFVYWPLVHWEDPPYKTTLLWGRWDVGPTGIRLFGVLNLVATVGFIVAAIGLALLTAWWPPVMVAAAVLSLVLTLLDFTAAYGGPIVDALLLALVYFAPRIGW